MSVYTLIEIRGIITGLEATNAAKAIHLLKQLHNRAVYLEAEKAENERNLSEPNNDET